MGAMKELAIEIENLKNQWTDVEGFSEEEKTTEYCYRFAHIMSYDKAFVAIKHEILSLIAKSRLEGYSNGMNALQQHLLDQLNALKHEFESGPDQDEQARQMNDEAHYGDAPTEYEF